MHPRTVLSLFDVTGAWSGPFALLGCQVLQADLQLGEDIAGWSATELRERVLCGVGEVWGVLAAPPCTDFASSGARWWPGKDAAGTTAASVHLARQVLRVVDLVQPEWWALENPAGRLQSLVPQVGRVRLSFDPWEFAGWTEPTPQALQLLDELRARGRGGAFTPEEVDAVREVGAYTKRTQLWGHFALPERRPVLPVDTTMQGSWLQGIGGAGARTKYLRSMTPLGFARAFAVAQVGGGQLQLDTA